MTHTLIERRAILVYDAARLAAIAASWSCPWVWSGCTSGIINFLMKHVGRGWTLEAG